MQVYNFGFSGTAMMEKEMGEVLGDREIDVLLVDAEPNAGIDGRMKENAEGFLNAFLAKSRMFPWCFSAGYFSRWTDMTSTG